MGARADVDAMCRVLLGAVLCIASVTAAAAATLHVARDGSGDFTVLAEAVEAAASGDTVRVAAGVYPEVRSYTAPGGELVTSAYVTVSELTIIGDDPLSVLIGPEQPAADLERGPAGITTTRTGNVRVRGVTVRNTSHGVWGNDVWVEVEDCVFVGNDQGVTGAVSGLTTVRRCEFREQEDAGVMVFEVRGATGAVVEDCLFVDNAVGLDFQPQNCELRDSEFRGGIVGAQISFGGSCVIERCTFQDIRNSALAVVGGSRVVLTDSRLLRPSGENIVIAGLLEGSGNILEGGSFSTITTYFNSVVRFHGNHIFNAGGWSVLTDDGGSLPTRTQDFSGNWWGTADPGQIDEWIHDRNDAPVVNYIYVEYEPLADQPISAESTSFGGLKSRFEPRQ